MFKWVFDLFRDEKEVTKPVTYRWVAVDGKDAYVNDSGKVLAVVYYVDGVFRAKYGRYHEDFLTHDAAMLAVIRHVDFEDWYANKEF
jgi:hypothetical protein